MKLRSRTRPGFTLVEMIVVIVMMSILAAAGLVGFGAMVSHFTRQSCIASRREAVQAYVSDWMQGDLSEQELKMGFNDWLDDYIKENQTEHGDRWMIKVTDHADGTYKVSITCRRHKGELLDPSAFELDDPAMEFGLRAP